MTGPFGSGCSYIAKEILKKCGYEYISLSDILRSVICSNDGTRSELQSNLCANKIAQVGIKKIVYFEPYPQKEAKETLKAHNVEQLPFEGVTFNSYFKFMEVLR